MTDSDHPEDDVIISVTPLVAAIRQLECAVELWFLDADAVSIHTLSAAAHQVVHDIHKKRCLDKELLFDASFVKNSRRVEFNKILKEASESFKHADWYPDRVVQITDLCSLTFMLAASQGLQNLGETIPQSAQAMMIWLALHRPEYVSPLLVEKVEQIAPGAQLTALRQIKKGQFLERFRQASGAFNGGKWPG